MRLLIINILLFFTTISAKDIKVSFGSCFKWKLDQDSQIFQQIYSHRPDVFVWLGDAAYLDDMIFPTIFAVQRNVSEIRRRFDITKNDENYKRFRELVNIIGVYDDHDFGLNNADGTNPMKHVIKYEYLNFLDRSYKQYQNIDGLYYSHQISSWIKIILLDTRFSKTEKSIIPEEQWQFLEKELASKHELFIIGSGIQIMTDDRIISEQWMPHDRHRLYQLVAKSKKRVIFISGDIHQSEILNYPCDTYGIKIVEITSSGLSFSNQDQFKYFNYITPFWIQDTYNTEKGRYLRKNYGLITLKPNLENKNKSSVLLQIYNYTNHPVINQTIDFDDFFVPVSSTCPQLEIDGLTRFRINLAYQIYLTLTQKYFIIPIVGILIYKKIKRMNKVKKEKEE